MVNYSDGKIYKLVNNVDDKIYVGSTCGTLRLRKSTHKSHAQRQKIKDRTVYKHLNQVGWGNVEIILIENCECKSRDELHRRERYWIDELKPELNKNIPRRTYAEWYQVNKEDIKQRHKEYRENNKEKIKQRETQKIACACGKTATRGHLKRHERSKKHQNYLKSLED